MSTLYGVDSSFDPLTLQEAQRLRAANVECYWQCLWTATQQPEPRVISLRNADAARLYLGAYISLNSSKPGPWHIDQGRAGVPDDIWQRLLFVAVDVELQGIRVEEIMKAVDRVITLGQRPTLYTSWNAWRNYIIPSNSPLLAQRGVLLNNANWDGAPDIDFPSLPFGTWTIKQVLSEQWSGGTMVEGQFVDRNTFVRELLLPQPPPPPVPTPANPCGLPILRAKFLEECSRAIANGDYNKLYSWARFFGGGPR